MSVRFSLRFAGRSWGRLLGVPNWPEVGRGSAVAIILVVVVVFVYKSTVLYILHVSRASSLPQVAYLKRGRCVLTLTLNLSTDLRRRKL